MNIDAAKLKGVLDCMDAEANERDKHTAQIREIVKKAKGDGFETKALRKVWQRRRMDADTRQHDDDLVDIYEHALGAKGKALRAIEGGAKVGEAAKDAGVHRATLARARHVAKQADDATPHDPLTGEITTEAGHLRDGGKGTPVTSRAGSVAVTNSESCGDDGSASIFSVTGSSGTTPKPEREPGPQDPIEDGTHQEEGEGEGRAARPDAAPVSLRVPAELPVATLPVIAPAHGEAVPTSAQPDGCSTDADWCELDDPYVARFAPHPDERADTATQLAEGNQAHEGDENDACVDIRVSEANGRSNGEDGARQGGGEDLQRRAGRGTAGRPGQDVRDPGAPLERDVGQRGDHAPTGRDAAHLTAGRGVDPSSTPPLGAVAEPEAPRVASPTDDGLDIPDFLDRRREIESRRAAT